MGQGRESLCTYLEVTVACLDLDLMTADLNLINLTDAAVILRCKINCSEIREKSNMWLRENIMN